MEKKLAKLEQDRLPVLEAREKNRAKGKKMVKKTEEECNRKLRKLNIEIQELQTSAKILS